MPVEGVQRFERLLRGVDADGADRDQHHALAAHDGVAPVQNQRALSTGAFSGRAGRTLCAGLWFRARDYYAGSSDGWCHATWCLYDQ